MSAASFFADSWSLTTGVAMSSWRTVPLSVRRKTRPFARSYSFCPKSRGGGAGLERSRPSAGAVVMLSLPGAVCVRWKLSAMPGFFAVIVPESVQVRVLGFVTLSVAEPKSP